MQAIPEVIEEEMKEAPPEPLTEEELREQLYRAECASPTNYLSSTLSINPTYKNLLSLKVKGMNLKFRVSNAASIATFKDVKINVQYLAKTGAIVKDETYSIYEYIGPNETVTYNVQTPISNQEYKDFTSKKITILSADCSM